MHLKSEQEKTEGIIIKNMFVNLSKKVNSKS